MAKYRIQATIEAARLPALVELLYEDVAQFDPELKIYRIVEYAVAEPSTAPIQPEPEPEPEPENSGARAEDVIMELLKTGPKRWSELQQALMAKKFGSSSINYVVRKGQKDGTMQRDAEGLWTLVEHAPS